MIKIVDFSNYTFRCSQLGYIMSEPRGKSNMTKWLEAKAKLVELETRRDTAKNTETKTHIKLLDTIDELEIKIEFLNIVKDTPNLSDTCKTMLAEIYTMETTGRVKDIKSKYLEKGLLLEEDAITAYSLYTGIAHRKNKERKYNKHIEGELDLVTKDTVHDTKVNWDVFTFDATAFKKINPIYEWQLDGYMDLWNKEHGKLVYVLLNTPEHLVKREQRKLMYDLFGGEPGNEEEQARFDEALQELMHKHIYDDLLPERKIRVFETKRSEERIQRIYKRVEECREYLNNFTKNQSIEGGDEE